MCILLQLKTHYAFMTVLSPSGMLERPLHPCISGIKLMVKISGVL